MRITLKLYIYLNLSVVTYSFLWSGCKSLIFAIHNISTLVCITLKWKTARKCKKKIKKNLNDLSSLVQLPLEADTCLCNFSLNQPHLAFSRYFCWSSGNWLHWHTSFIRPQIEALILHFCFLFNFCKFISDGKTEISSSFISIFSRNIHFCFFYV